MLQTDMDERVITDRGHTLRIFPETAADLPQIKRKSDRMY